MERAAAALVTDNRSFVRISGGIPHCLEWRYRLYIPKHLYHL